MLGTIPESMTWQPKTGYLWTTSGNATSGLPTNGMSGYMWIAWDIAKKKWVDSLKWYDPQIPLYGNDQRPRGIAFNKNGDTCYVACFNSNVTPPSSYVEQFARTGAVYVEPNPGVIPTGFALSQNYPNPFNPSTEIKFQILKSGMTTLKVYDVMGREVSTIVNETMAAGSYTVKFDASHLSSGTYIYILTSGGNTLTNKMVLIK
jgi:DNA-binding beta-propeller fold protein YncE